MSNYPQWWDTDITIYNRYEDPQTHVIRWFRTNVSGAFWKYVRDKVVIGETTLETDKTICRIREDARFKERYQWISLPNDQMNQFFTFGRQDIIVRGNIAEDIDEYTQGQRSTDFIDKYKAMQGCMEIESISINVGGGRNNPHYLIEGL